MLTILSNVFQKPILREMVNDDVLREHIEQICEIHNIGYFRENEVEELLETVKHDNEVETRNLLTSILDVSDAQIDSLVEEIYTLLDREILFTYYMKKELSEKEIRLLKAFELLVSLNQEAEEYYEQAKQDIIECLVTKIEYTINEHTIRIWNKEIFDLLNKKLRLEDKYAEEENNFCRSKYLRYWDFSELE